MSTEVRILVRTTMQISAFEMPKLLQMWSSMNVDGFPTTTGSRCVAAAIAPTIAPPPAHFCADVKWVTASLRRRYVGHSVTAVRG